MTGGKYAAYIFVALLVGSIVFVAILGQIQTDPQWRMTRTVLLRSEPFTDRSFPSCGEARVGALVSVEGMRTTDEGRFAFVRVIDQRPEMAMRDIRGICEGWTLETNLQRVR